MSKDFESLGEILEGFISGLQKAVEMDQVASSLKRIDPKKFSHGGPIKPEKKYKNGSPFIFEYIKRGGKIRGVLIGYKVTPDSFVCGWSLCNPRDEFSWHEGISIAYDCCFEAKEVPCSILEQYKMFRNERCMAYFQDCCWVSPAALPLNLKSWTIFFKDLPDFMKKRIRESARPERKEPKETFLGNIQTINITTPDLGDGNIFATNAREFGKQTISIEMENGDVFWGYSFVK